MDNITYDSNIIKAHLKCNGHVIWISIPRITAVNHGAKEETCITINAGGYKSTITVLETVDQINKMIEEGKND